MTSSGSMSSLLRAERWPLSSLRASGTGDECLERVVERAARVRGDVTSAGNVCAFSMESVREVITQGLEDGAVVAGDHQLREGRSRELVERQLAFPWAAADGPNGFDTSRQRPRQLVAERRVTSNDLGKAAQPSGLIAGRV
jgi:hypothetical protein